MQSCADLPEGRPAKEERCETQLLQRVTRTPSKAAKNIVVVLKI